MGNKIVRILGAEQVSSVNYVETFRDLSMVSEKSSLDSALSCPSIEDYIKYLKTESDDTELSAIAVDPSMSDEEVIAKLAMFLDTDYYVELAKYEQYLNKSRYKISKINDVAATKNSLHNIFTWTPGQRILNPNFGSRLESLLYEGITEQNKDAIVAEIKSAATTYEPRVEIIDVIDMTNAYEVENSGVCLQIIFTIPALTQGEKYSETLFYNTTQL